MKKSLFILAAASAVAFAACNGGNNEGSYTKEQADSMAQAKIDSANAAMKTANDSLIQAQAAAEARTADSIRVIDSIIAATKASSSKTTVIRKTTGGGKTTTTTTTKTEEVSSTPPAIDKQSTSNRPGAKNTTSTQNKEASAPKSVSDRPGAK